jgi:hypothetical protein
VPFDLGAAATNFSNPADSFHGSWVSKHLAYTVTIERSQALVAGQTPPMPMARRVTHVFRKEHGAWKLLHCHPNHLVEKTAPGNVLRK